MSDFHNIEGFQYREVPEIQKNSNNWGGVFKNCHSFIWIIDSPIDTPFIRKLDNGKYDIFPYFDSDSIEDRPFEPIPFDDLDSAINYYYLKFV